MRKSWLLIIRFFLFLEQYLLLKLNDILHAVVLLQVHMDMLLVIA